MKVVCVAGYNSTAARTFGVFQGVMAHLGVDCWLWEYPQLALGSRWNGRLSGLVGARLCNRARGRRLARYIRQSGIHRVVAHSNGCLVADHAARHTRIDVLIALHPALDRDRVFAKGVRRAYVYHDIGDAPVRWARWFIGHEWGAMGAYGTTVDLAANNGRVTNVAYDPDEEYGVDEHSEILHRDWMVRLAPQMKAQLS